MHYYSFMPTLVAIPHLSFVVSEKAFESLFKNVNIHILVEQFLKIGNTKDHIEEAGEIAARILYHANEEENINALRKRLLSK